MAILGAMGFFAGISLVLVDTGDILKYPAHLLVGTIIVVLLLTTFTVSRKISGPEALRIGLVNEVWPNHELKMRAHALAKEINSLIAISLWTPSSNRCCR